MTDNLLYYGDNLEVLRLHVQRESVDLVYLDPPFNSNQNYNILFAEQDGSRSAAQIKAFEDTWQWNRESAAAYEEVVEAGGRISDAMQAFRKLLGSSNMMAYLAMMGPRLLELRSVLKLSGSMYLHCDPTASHYLKILMDAIFGPDQFRNEIIWRRTGAHGPRRSFGPIHDVILFYSRTNKYFFRVVRGPYMRGHVARRYRGDDTGRFKFTSGGNVLTGSGRTGGESGMPWRGFDPSAKNRHWAVPGFLTEQMPPEFAHLGVQAKLDALHEAGLVEITEGNAWPVPVRYLDDLAGQPIQDIWAYQPYTEGTVAGTDEGIDADVAWLGPTDPERVGYQTQKPLGLLERIIASCCPTDGVVLDPFCGCGTTIIAAEKLNRQWIGIDVTHLAITLMRERLRDSFGEKVSYRVVGEPVSVPDAAQLARTDPYQFQWWALGLVGARPIEEKKGADQGIDGRSYFHDDAAGQTKEVILSVKAGATGPNHVRDLRGVLDREKAEIGVLITFAEPTRAMMSEAASAGFYQSPGWQTRHPRLQILTVESLLKGQRIDMPPSRQVSTTFRRSPRARTAPATNLSLPLQE